MKAWIADNFADAVEDDVSVTEGKSVIIYGTKAEVIAIAKFMAEVARYLEGADFCHMHLRDNMAGWSALEHIDVEVTVDDREPSGR